MRKICSSDVSDPEWKFVVPYLWLLPEDDCQRVHSLREVFDALRWLVRHGAPWRYLPKDFPPWEMVYRQTCRWLAAGGFEAIDHDLRDVLRFADSGEPEPTAIIFRWSQGFSDRKAAAGQESLIASPQHDLPASWTQRHRFPLGCP